MWWFSGQDYTSGVFWRLRLNRMILYLHNITFNQREKSSKTRLVKMKHSCIFEASVWFTQQRMMSQIISIGASVFIPSGFTWVPEIRYWALITADLNIAADGEMHFSVAQRLCRLKNRGTSSNSWKNIETLKSIISFSKCILKIWTHKSHNLPRIP